MFRLVKKKTSDWLYLGIAGASAFALYEVLKNTQLLQEANKLLGNPSLNLSSFLPSGNAVGTSSTPNIFGLDLIGLQNLFGLATVANDLKSAINSIKVPTLGNLTSTPTANPSPQFVPQPFLPTNNQPTAGVQAFQNAQDSLQQNIDALNNLKFVPVKPQISQSIMKGDLPSTVGNITQTLSNASQNINIGLLKTFGVGGAIFTKDITLNLGKSTIGTTFDLATAMGNSANAFHNGLVAVSNFFNGLHL